MDIIIISMLAWLHISINIVGYKSLQLNYFYGYIYHAGCMGLVCVYLTMFPEFCFFD